MAAQTQDKFQKKGASTVTTLSAPGKAIGAGSITVGSTTNYPTDTGITIAIRVVDTNGDLVAGTYTEWNAIVASGTSFTIDTTPAYGSDQIYAAGSTTQVFIPLSSYSHNKMIDALLTEHDQDGTHGAVTATSVATTGAVTAGNGLTVTTGTVSLPAGSIETADLAGDAVTAEKMQYGMVRNRQGGTTGDAAWNTTGTSNTDTTAKAAFIQVGTITSSGAGDTTVTFPTAFNKAPIVQLTTVAASGSTVISTLVSTSTTTFVFSNWTTVPARFVAVTHWVAIGQ